MTTCQPTSSLVTRAPTWCRTGARYHMFTITNTTFIVTYFYSLKAVPRSSSHISYAAIRQAVPVQMCWYATTDVLYLVNIIYTCISYVYVSDVLCTRGAAYTSQSKTLTIQGFHPGEFSRRSQQAPKQSQQAPRKFDL